MLRTYSSSVIKHYSKAIFFLRPLLLRNTKTPLYIAFVPVKNQVGQITPEPRGIFHSPSAALECKTLSVINSTILNQIALMLFLKQGVPIHLTPEQAHRARQF